MTQLADANLLPIILAVVIGLLIGWWIFRSLRKGSATNSLESSREADASVAARPTPEPRPDLDSQEGNGIADQGAAATADVSGQILGAPVHSELPGADGAPDHLETMKGVGPKFVAKLNENGITRFAQLARLDEAQVTALDERMGAFKGRLHRDRVIDQAHYLARGDTEGFEAKFGKLGSGTL